MHTEKLDYFNTVAAQLLLEAIGARNIQIQGRHWRKLEFTMRDGTVYSIDLGPDDTVPVPAIDAFIGQDNRWTTV